MILGQKANKDASMANPNGALHAIDALRPYQFVGCNGNEGRGHNKLLGKCSSIGCSSRTQASIPHLGPSPRCNDEAIQVGH